MESWCRQRDAEDAKRTVQDSQMFGTGIGTLFIPWRDAVHGLIPGMNSAHPECEGTDNAHVREQVQNTAGTVGNSRASVYWAPAWHSTALPYPC